MCHPNIGENKTIHSIQQKTCTVHVQLEPQLAYGKCPEVGLNEVKNTCLFHLLQLIEDVINIIYKISVKLDNITMSL